MKKFLVVLLSLGLIAAFAATASAATSDVKFSGAYYVGGIYDNNPALNADAARNSVSKFHQRLRLKPVFTVAQGLTFTAQFDALEKDWGSTKWSGGTGADVTKKDQTDKTGSRASTGTGGVSVQENIEFELAFVTFQTGIGTFNVGYQTRDGWGTDFMTNLNTRPSINWSNVFGPMTVGAFWDKRYEGSGATNSPNMADADSDAYGAYGIYKWTGGEAGLMYKYIQNNQFTVVANIPAAWGTKAFKQKMHGFSPYFKANVGPLYLEGEMAYAFGKAFEGSQYDATFKDKDVQAFGAYLKGVYTMGPAYVGASYAYITGSDPDYTSTNDSDVKAPYNWDKGSYGPAIIMGGGTRGDIGGNDVGGVTGGGTAIGDKTPNIIFYNLHGGYNVNPKLNVEVNLSYATTQVTPKSGGVEYVSNKYGTELDVSASYKIFDNLTYWVGAGYLWAGDYFKGTSQTVKIGNDYVFINKLELTF